MLLILVFSIVCMAYCRC